MVLIAGRQQEFRPFPGRAASILPEKIVCDWLAAWQAAGKDEKRNLEINSGADAAPPTPHLGFYCRPCCCPATCARRGEAKKPSSPSDRPSVQLRRKRVEGANDVDDDNDDDGRLLAAPSWVPVCLT